MAEGLSSEDVAYQARLEQIQKLGLECTQAIEAVKSNERLTALGKHDEVVRLKDEAREKLRGLRQENEELVARERAALERTLWGPPAPNDPQRMILYRDATDRAERAKSSAELLALYRRGAEIGDDSQLRACVAVAVRRRWKSVLFEHAAVDESGKAALDRLEELGARSSPRNRAKEGWETTGKHALGLSSKPGSDSFNPFQKGRR